MTDVCGRFAFPQPTHSCGNLREFDPNCLRCIVSGEKLLHKCKMNFEMARLESFVGWPVPNISAKSMARNGFYYTKTSDQVVCNFCGLGLTDWEPNDSPKAEHKKYSPRCPLMNGSAVDNVPILKPNKVFKAPICELL